MYLSPMSSSQSAPPSTTTCPRCSTPGTGRFCTECGAPLQGAPCAECGETLTPGAKFCHRCGAAAGAAATTAAAAAAGGGATTEKSGLATTLPWAVAGIAFLALFAMLAGKGFNARRGSAVDAPQNALPNPTVDAPAMDGEGGNGDAAGPPPGSGAVRAPDISKLTPAEIADRLFNRIMLLNSQGKRDSVQFFAPMAIQAYQMLEQQQGHAFDTDQRYDVGRIAAVAGALPVAKVEADTILQQSPDHLLGLILAAQVARLSGDAAAQRGYAQHFARVKRAELAKQLPEYQRHRTDIDAGA